MAKVFSIDSHTLSYGGFILRELGNGSLTISKTVSGSGFDPAKTFEIVVTFSVPVTYNGTTSTTHTLNLAHGQSVTISNIPEFTTYNVTETALTPSEVEAGYSIIGITGGSGTVIEGEYSATASNQFRNKATLTISKSITGSGFDPTKTFEIVVTFGSAILYSVNGTTISTASSTYTANLADGQSVVLGNIPDGTTYSIEESPLSPSDQNAGYHYSGITNPSGTAVWDGVYSSVVSNRYHPAGGSLKIRFEDGSYDPTSGTWKNGSSWSRVSTSPNIWQYARASSDWTGEFRWNRWVGSPVFHVIEADLDGVTDMTLMFQGTNLKTTVLFNVSQSIYTASMFSGTKLVTPPLFDTAFVYNCDSMFTQCTGISSQYINSLFEVQKVKDAVSNNNAPHVSTASNMFKGCTGVSGIPTYFGGTQAYNTLGQDSIYIGQTFTVKCGDELVINLYNASLENSVTLEYVSGDDMFWNLTAPSKTILIRNTQAEYPNHYMQALWRWGKQGTYVVTAMTGSMLGNYTATRKRYPIVNY